MQTRTLATRAGLIAVAIATLSITASSSADVFQVNTFEDGNDGACNVNGCTLREAIIEAAGTPGNDEILLQAGVYQLSLGGVDNGSIGGDLDINFGTVTISGFGAGVTIIDGGDIDRVFDVAPLGGGGALELVDLTVRNGLTTGFETGGGIRVVNTGALGMLRCEIASCGAPDDGGGIAVYGNATLVDSWIHGCSCTANFGNGGALFCRGTTGPGLITAEGCLFNGNSGPNGGSGCFADVFGTANFTNCTFTANGPTDTILVNSGNASFESCTISNNGWGIAALSGTTTMRNTILAMNGPVEFIGTITSEGYNLFGPGSTSAIAGDGTGNIYGTNPLLGPLVNNGGATMTRALLDGSAAIDAGSRAGFPGVDQRGAPRPADGNGDLVFATDIGAFEAASEPFVDCNGNGVNDATDIDEGTSQDCNGNGIPDECDIATGAETDCNGNGVPDPCDIADGVLHDDDGSGVPDECEDEGDLDGSGAVDGADLGQMLSNWGECPDGCPADLNGDGVVDGADMGLLLGGWG